MNISAKISIFMEGLALVLCDVRDTLGLPSALVNGL